MRVIRSAHLGMCFGVRHAIALALDTATRRPLTILGDLVHNETVLEDLRGHGIRFCSTLADVETRTVMISAHGASRKRMDEAKCRGLHVVDATCPLVRTAHRSVTALVRDGCHPVIVGKPGHVEVRGLTEDLEAFDVVLHDDDVFRLDAHAQFGVVAQTTQPVARVDRIVSLMRGRFPGSEVRVANTVCLPTRLRQQAAQDLARQCDVVLVVGGVNSNNTRELAATCRTCCARVFPVQGPDDVRPEWFAGASVAGITAGTSTPDAVIDAVCRACNGIGADYSVARIDAQICNHPAAALLPIAGL